MPEGLNNDNQKYSLSLNDILTGGKDLTDKIPFYIQVVDDKGEIKSLYTGEEEVYSLRLDVNPASINMNMAKLVSRTQTMTAWVEDHWGEELDTVTLQGSTAAFVVGGKSLYGIRNGNGISKNIDESRLLRRSFNEALGLVDLQPSLPADSYGLTTLYRTDAVSYKKMKRILELMRTNGARFDTDGLGMVTSRNFIQLAHDYGVYLGFFESIDLGEDASNPFKFTYTITFRSEKTLFSYLG